MKVLLGKVLVDLDGKEIPSESGPATLCGVAVNALLAVFQDEQNLTGEEKLKRWELAVKVKNLPDPAELSADEVVLIKKLIGKAYAPIIVGQAWQMLEGK